MTPRKRFFEFIIPGVPILAAWELVLSPTLSRYVWVQLVQRTVNYAPGQGLFLFFLGLSCDQWFKLLIALSLPGALIGLPIEIPLQTVLNRHPEVIYINKIATALTTPFFCWPAGWFAGRGWDAFVAKRPCRTWVTILGSILCLGCTTLGVSGLFSGKDFWELAGLWGGGLLWTAAFSVFPANWWRLRKKRSETKLLT